MLSQIHWCVRATNNTTVSNGFSPRFLGLDRLCAAFPKLGVGVTAREGHKKF